LVSLRQAFRHSPGDKYSAPYRLVVYVTGGPSDGRLMQVVEKISERQNTLITIAYVVEVDQSMPLDAELPSDVDRGEEVLVNTELWASKCVGGRRENIRTELLQARSAGPAIVDEAIETGASAIMLAAVLKKKHGRLELGETVAYVLRHAPCEVVVIREATALPMTDDLETQ